MILSVNFLISCTLREGVWKLNGSYREDTPIHNARDAWVPKGVGMNAI